MPDDWLIIGILIGLCIGIPIGLLLIQSYSSTKPTTQPVSILFDRDKEGRIISIHYVPVNVRTT